MKKQTQVTQVEIYGQTYSVRAAADADYIRELAGFVDRKMREVAQEAATVDATKIAILAALNVADDYYQFRVRLSEGDPGRVAKRATRLVEKLDEILGKSPGGVPAKAGEESIGALRGA